MTDIYECAGAVFRLPNGDIILQKRDDKPGINSPGKVHVFAGSAKHGEDNRQTMERELTEETGIDKKYLEHAEYLDTFDEPGQHPPGIHRDAIFIVPCDSAQELKVLEGAGHVVVSRKTDISQLPLTNVAYRVLGKLGFIAE